MTKPAIEIQGLTKEYGDTKALDGVDLVVQEGSVFGFLGPNGAGKTTTLRILTGLAKATRGSAKIFGHDVTSASNEARSLLGFLPDVPQFYPWMTAEEFLRFAGSLFGLSREILAQRVPVLLELAGLSKVSARVGGYSRGMKQRLGIAQALINAPKLLMLDEPTSALDPIGRKEVLEMLSALSGRATVLFSTHILSDVERVCDHVAILTRGKVATQSSIAELTARYGAQVIEVEVEEGAEALEGALSSFGWLSSCSRSNQRLRLEVRDLAEAQRALPSMLASLSLRLRRFETNEATLEEVFVKLAGEKP